MNTLKLRWCRTVYQQRGVREACSGPRQSQPEPVVQVRGRGRGRALGLSRGDGLARGRALSFLRGQGHTRVAVGLQGHWASSRERNGVSLVLGVLASCEVGRAKGKCKGPICAGGAWTEFSRDLARWNLWRGGGAGQGLTWRWEVAGDGLKPEGVGRPKA